MRFFRRGAPPDKEIGDAPAPKTIRRRTTITLERQWVAMHLGGQPPPGAAEPAQGTDREPAPPMQLPPPGAPGNGGMENDP
jgi:hypothetical protein